MGGSIRLSIAAVVFGLAAFWFLFWGFTMNTTVNPDGLGDVANLQMMHVQSLNFAVGIGAAVMSAIFFAGSVIVGALRKRD